MTQLIEDWIDRLPSTDMGGLESPEAPSPPMITWTGNSAKPTVKLD